MLLSEFDYDLPESFIAQTPCEPRDHSKLLILDSQTGRIEHKIFYQLKEYLKPGDTIIFNLPVALPCR